MSGEKEGARDDEERREDEIFILVMVEVVVEIRITVAHWRNSRCAAVIYIWGRGVFGQRTGGQAHWRAG